MTDLMKEFDEATNKFRAEHPDIAKQADEWCAKNMGEFSKMSVKVFPMSEVNGLVKPYDVPKERRTDNG